MVQNGRVPITSLTTLLNGERLLNSQARAVNTAVHVGGLLGISIHTPLGGDKGTSSYRDLAMQALFVRASRGDVAAAKRCNMDPNMRTHMGAVGSQSHGWADRIDLLFNGHSPSISDLALMKRYGGIQEFGADDPNHIWIKNPVSDVAESDKNRICAHFLNRQNLHWSTSTDQDGKWPTVSNFSGMLQEYGAGIKDWYPQPKYKIDREAGARTKWVRNELFKRLWTS
jgi:hypothetical protein